VCVRARCRKKSVGTATRSSLRPVVHRGARSHLVRRQAQRAAGALACGGDAGRVARARVACGERAGRARAGKQRRRRGEGKGDAGVRLAGSHPWQWMAKCPTRSARGRPWLQGAPRFLYLRESDSAVALLWTRYRRPRPSPNCGVGGAFVHVAEEQAALTGGARVRVPALALVVRCSALHGRTLTLCLGALVDDVARGWPPRTTRRARAACAIRTGGGAWRGARASPLARQHCRGVRGSDALTQARPRRSGHLLPPAVPRCPRAARSACGSRGPTTSEGSGARGGARGRRARLRRRAHLAAQRPRHTPANRRLPAAPPPRSRHGLRPTTVPVCPCRLGAGCVRGEDDR
jgi:hypothetical protein